MMTPRELSDLSKQFRTKAQGAMSLNIAFIGIVDNLFDVLNRAGKADTLTLARSASLDRDYVQRWAEAAYALEYLDLTDGFFSLTDQGRAMLPDQPGTLMPLAIGAVLSTHMADRAAELMQTGERPGEKVLGERKNILPWFGAMLEANFSGLFEREICPGVPVFQEINRKGGRVVDLGCGNGWYLRSLAIKCEKIKGIGLDGFSENIRQAQTMADRQHLSDRLTFQEGDIKTFAQQEPVDLIAMNRALHHVWDEKETVFAILRDHVRDTGAIVIWEPAWPKNITDLRSPGKRPLAVQNLGEHVQGNRLLTPEEISDQFLSIGMTPEIYLFSEGNEAVIVGRKF